MSTLRLKAYLYLKSLYYYNYVVISIVMQCQPKLVLRPPWLIYLYNLCQADESPFLQVLILGVLLE